MNDILTILFFGKTGVGKSSTINRLFGLDWATDNAIACTKEPQTAILDSVELNYSNIPYKQIRIVDMPGIGESLSADETYLCFYEEWMPKADSLVWVTQADTRAYKRDQLFFLKLSSLFHPSLFLTLALNKIDYLGVEENEEPFDFEEKKPSEDQLKRIPEKIDDIHSIFSDVIGGHLSFEKSQIVPYTCFYGWGLDNLKTKIITRS